VSAGPVGHPCEAIITAPTVPVPGPAAVPVVTDADDDCTGVGDLNRGNTEALAEVSTGGLEMTERLIISVNILSYITTATTLQ